MNASILLGLMLILNVSYAQARDFTDWMDHPQFTDFIQEKIGTVLPEDPLNIKPPVLNMGVMLPQDQQVLACPVPYDEKQGLTLDAAIDMALCNQPKVKAAWMAIKVQSAALGQAQAPYLPTINGTVSHLLTHTDYKNSDVTTNVEGNMVNLSLNWRLLDLGGRSANREMSDQLLQSAIFSYDATLQKTLASVIQAYFEAMTAHAVIEARTKETQLADAILQSAKTREAKGDVARNDTLRSSTALARAELAQQRAQGDYDKSLAMLAYAMGLSFHEKPSLATTPAMMPDMSEQELDVWLKQTEDQHPAIKAAKAQWLAAQKKVDIARSENLPSLDFTTNYYLNGYPGQGLQVTQSGVSNIGLTLNLPLFSGFDQTYKIRGAQALVEQREAEMLDAQNQVMIEVVKAYADAKASLNNLGYADTLLDSAKAGMDSSEKRYRLGEADISEQLKAESDYAEANQERIRCQSEWRSAKLRLFANAGVLGRAMLVKYTVPNE